MKIGKLNNNDGTSTYRVYEPTGLPFDTINGYLFFLENIGRAPNTIKAQAQDLIGYFRYLKTASRDWKLIELDDWVGFVHHLKCATSSDVLSILPVNGQQVRSATTINRFLSTINSFYRYQNTKSDIHLPNAHEFVTAPYTNTYKSFLSFASAARPKSVSKAYKIVGRQKHVKSLESCKVVSADNQRKMVQSCNNRRDRLLVLLLVESGMRIGQALGLKHEDVESWNNRVNIKYRADNPNNAYSKSLNTLNIDVSTGWFELYTDFLLTDLRDLDTDFIFTNLYNRNRRSVEAPMSYATVKALFSRLSKKIGTKLTPHMLRHSHATELLRSGMSIELTAKRLGHVSIETTKKSYEHLTAEDMRDELIKIASRNDFLSSLYSVSSSLGGSNA